MYVFWHQGPVSQKARKLFGPVKPVLDHLYLIKGSREQLMDECYLLLVSKRVLMGNICHKNELMNLEAEVI